MSLLTANLGNSRFSLAWFEGANLLDFASFPLDAEPQASLASFLKTRRPVRTVLCSVNPPAEKRFAEALSHAAGELRRVGRGLAVPMPILCRPPEKVGQDRLVAAWEAWSRENRECVVLDFGTAVTLSAVSAKGEFLGGAIAPGLGLAAKALAQHTAQLPEAALRESKSILARSTEEAIAAGISIGWIGLAEKWIEEARRELGAGLAVFATGGDLEKVRRARGIDHLCPHLLHEGLARLASRWPQ